MLDLNETGNTVHLTRDQLTSLRDITSEHEHSIDLVQLEDLYVRIDFMDKEGTTKTGETLLFPLGPSR